MSEKIDTRLVTRAKKGDVAAFESLYRWYNDRLYNFVRQLPLPPEDAADVVQESFIRAWNSLPSLRNDAMFGSWLHRIALNRGRDLLERRTRRPVVPIDDLSPEGTSTDIADGSSGPEQELIKDDMSTAVRRAVSTLSDDHRLVVTMHHMEGMDVQSISEALNISKGTVMSRLSRARESLRRKLAPYVEEA